MKRNIKKINLPDYRDIAAAFPVPTLFILFLVLAAIFTFLYPAINWPDEVYKISTLGDTQNIYLKTVDWLSGQYCNIGYSTFPDAAFGSNRFTLQLTYGQACYVKLKFVNLTLIVVIAAICTCLLRNRNDRKLFLLSLIWPSSIFYLTSINNQVVFHLVAVFMGVLSVRGYNVLILIVASMFLIVVDRSFVTVLIWLLIVFGSRRHVKTTLGCLVILMLIQQAIPNVFDGIASSVLGQDIEQIETIRNSVSVYRDSIIFSVAILAISFVYFGGLSSVFGIGLDYIFVWTTLTLRVLNLPNDKKYVRLLLLAFAGEYLIVVDMIPTIQSFRYFVFIMPLLLDNLLYDQKDYSKYVAYCCSMILIYVIQSYLFQGATW